MARKSAKKKPATLLRLDLGCGKSPRAGFEGVDVRDFEGVDHLVDLRAPWPWEDESVAEAHCSHFLEHLKAPERIHFVNELQRVLIPEGSCQLITPHWASCRAYGDLTHEWPPVSEFWFYYLSADWRAQNAPHNDGYVCDFDVTWGYALTDQVAARNQEYQAFAMANYKEAIMDTIATLTKR